MLEAHLTMFPRGRLPWLPREHSGSFLLPALRMVLSTVGWCYPRKNVFSTLSYTPLRTGPCFPGCPAHAMVPASPFTGRHHSLRLWKGHEDRCSWGVGGGKEGAGKTRLEPLKRKMGQSPEHEPLGAKTWRREWPSCVLETLQELA